MSEIKIIDSKEVWWATTKEYELDVEGEITTVRIAETPKSTEFLQWNEKSGWEEADTDGWHYEDDL